MKVLVTGRHGQLARSLAERAVSYPNLEVGFANRPEFDLEKPDTIARTIAAVSPDVVINAAAFTNVDLAEDERERAYRINAAAAGELADAARKVGARIIQISTDYVFDGTRGAPYSEDAAADPINVYGRSKLAGEEAVRLATSEHMIVRTAWLYSPFGRNFVKRMVELAEIAESVRVVDDQHGSPTSALDLADGLLRLIDAWRSRRRLGLGEVYHLAGDREGTTWCGLATDLFAISAAHGGRRAAVVPIATRDWPAKAPRPVNSRLDSRKFAHDFGYEAPPWRESVAAVVKRLIRERMAA